MSALSRLFAGRDLPAPRRPRDAEANARFLMDLADEYDSHGDPSLDGGRSRALRRIAGEHLGMAELIADRIEGER